MEVEVLVLVMTIVTIVVMLVLLAGAGVVARVVVVVAEPVSIEVLATAVVPLVAALPTRDAEGARTHCVREPHD